MCPARARGVLRARGGRGHSVFAAWVNRYSPCSQPSREGRGEETGNIARYRLDRSLGERRSDKHSFQELNPGTIPAYVPHLDPNILFFRMIRWLIDRSDEYWPSTKRSTLGAAILTEPGMGF